MFVDSYKQFVVAKYGGVEMKYTVLKEIVKEVIRGVPSRVPQESSTELFDVINIKNLVDGRIDLTTIEKREVPVAQRREEKQVRAGDVIVAIRGTQFRAAIADENVDGLYVTSNLVVLRVDHSKMRPEIVKEYLNSPHGQNQLGLLARGATIPSISIKDLLTVSVPLLPLETQDLMKEYIGAVNDYLSMLRREEELTAQIRDGLFVRFCGVAE